MLSVQEAQELIAAEVRAAMRQFTRSVPIGETLGRTLSEVVVSDIDSPPHDKSIVDGYAVVAEDVSAGTELTILEEVTAGALPAHAVTTGTAIRIMTGAPLPAGATGVVMVEKTETSTSEPSRVKILETPRSGQNIGRRAASLRRGEIVLHAGVPLTPARIGLLAEVGRAEVKIACLPTIAVLTTGNEIVPVDTIPGPGQIRNSNGPMLEALAKQMGAQAISLGAARDEQRELAALIRRGLQADFLVLSGGVSAGVLDLVPGVLAELGVRQVFHKVNLKPGKPIWFGVFSKERNAKTLVFGLPGNPVSSFVCFELFVRYALGCIRQELVQKSKSARLAVEHHHRGDRPTYWPALCEADESDPLVTLLPWKGSGDLKTLADANSLAFFAGKDRVFHAGEEVTVFLL